MKGGSFVRIRGPSLRTDRFRRWFVDVPRELVMERIVQRHLAAGIETSREASVLRAEDNDLPNGDLIRAKLIEPVVRISN
jgi:pantothenate kinase